LIVFHIPNAGKNVRLGSLRVWLYLSLYGYIALGKHGRFDWYGFRCKDCNALRADYMHGYSQSQYYLQCQTCGYKQLCGDRL
jgi:hypothetical protein